MSLEEAVKIISKEYEVDMYTPTCYFITTKYSYNAFDIVTLYLVEENGKILITEKGAAEAHSEKDESEVKKICESEGFTYDEGYLIKEFSSLQDVEKLIALIDKIC